MTALLFETDGAPPVIAPNNQHTALHIALLTQLPAIKPISIGVSRKYEPTLPRKVNIISCATENDEIV
jgi:hypothetical protein